MSLFVKRALLIVGVLACMAVAFLGSAHAQTSATNYCLKPGGTPASQPCSESNPLFVSPVAGGADQDVNLVGINGTAPVTGSGTATAALRVELPTNGTGVVGLNAGSAIIGNVRIDQTTPGTTNGVVINSGVLSNSIGITPTDRTITSATGASQTVMALNASRHSLIIQNTGNQNCGVNPTGGTAAIGGAGTLTLLPSGSYQPRIPTLSAVTAICTSGQTLYAEEN